MGHALFRRKDQATTSGLCLEKLAYSPSWKDVKKKASPALSCPSIENQPTPHLTAGNGPTVEHEGSGRMLVAARDGPGMAGFTVHDQLSEDLPVSRAGLF